MGSHPAKRQRQSSDREIESSTLASDPEKLSLVVVFAHGAGAPSSSPRMIRWKDMLREALHAAEVLIFDYPYISGGKRKAPPRAEKLVECHSRIVKETAAKFILAGKSMGSRVSCMVAGMKEINVSAVVCLDYPLKGIYGGVRDETLLELTIPTILCPLEKLEATRKKMKVLSELHVIDGGDHSFKFGKKHMQLKGSSQDEAEDAAVQAIAAFVPKLLENKE